MKIQIILFIAHKYTNRYRKENKLMVTEGK